METKNKIVVLLEIAVVLCSVFFMALPVIAAEQNQTTQEVSASTSAITTSSEDDFVLGVYGNANEDDTIDMRDLTYVKLIFFGKKPETELADAKYDGKINPLDFIQIKLIIVGKEKELTLIDSADRIVTVKKPVQRVFALADVEVFEVIKAQDKVVGVYTQILTDPMFPGWNEMPATGFTPDYEVILSVNPDLLVCWTSKAATHNEKLPDSITVIGLELYYAGTLIEEMAKLGYILDKEDAVKHYVEDFNDKYIDSIDVQTEKLSEEEKPKVYVESGGHWGPADYKTYSGTSLEQMVIDRAGGKNIFADIEQDYFEVDPEEVVMRNPGIIIKFIRPMDVGYDEDLFKIEAARARDEMMNRPELANVDAVKNGMVYVFDWELTLGPTHPISVVYWAKLFHPDLFEDLDPQAIYEEYLTEYKGVDLDLLPFDMDDEIWIYPPFE